MSATTAYQQRLARLRHSTAIAVATLWRDLPDYHAERAEPFARGAAAAVAAGQMLTARATGAYLARRLSIPPVAIDRAVVTGAAVRRGVEPVDVYQRPFGKVWHALAEGEDLEVATSRGLDYATMLAVTDVALSMRAANAFVADAAGVDVTWVRAADGGACPECSASDGQAYDRAEDMGLHPFCSCTLEGIRGPSTSEAADPEAVDTEENDELGAVLRPSNKVAA